MHVAYYRFWLIAALVFLNCCSYSVNDNFSYSISYPLVIALVANDSR